MDIIKNNPYRIIGILVGTSTKDEHTKTKKLKMYIGAQQEVPEDFSFPIIGTLNRDSINVEDAISKLNLNNDRVNASLFWFYNGNAITDEPVFDVLKLATAATVKEAQEGIDVWRKLTTAQEVTKINASAFQNLSTLILNFSYQNLFVSKNYQNYHIYIKRLVEAIILKLKFLESDFAFDFIKLSSDETYKVSKESLQIYFLTQVYNEIEKVDATFVDWYIKCISKISFTAKQNYLKDFVSKPIEHIKTRIEETKAKRKENPSKGYDLGLSLFENENEKIKTIQNILDKSNIQFTSISDKLSDEILQCGIVYFKKYRDTNTDPSAKAMDLFKNAKKFAVGSIAIQRCQENTENLQEWIDDKSKRDNEKSIATDLKVLTAIISNYRNKNETIENAIKLVNESKPILERVKAVLGSKNVLYLKISTNVAAMAQNFVITNVNEIQENESREYIDQFSPFSMLKKVFELGLKVINLIGTLDMENDYKTNRFNPNRDSIESLCDRFTKSTLPEKKQSFATRFYNFIDDWGSFVFYGLAILMVLLLFIYLIWGLEGLQMLLGIVGVVLMFGFLGKYGPKKQRRG